MFVELSATLRTRDRRKLAERLDSQEPNEAIAAMWELAIVWALNKELGALPYLNVPGIKPNPDAELNLGMGRPVAVDVKSASGDTFDFSNYLTKATNSIKMYFDQIAPQSTFTYFITYHEWRYPKKHIRRRPGVCADPTISKQFCDQFEIFIRSGEKHKRFNVPGIIYATFERREYFNRSFQYHCDVPPLIQTSENNQSDNAIKTAKRQLGPFKLTHFVGLIICDGGNNDIADPYSIRDWATAGSRQMMLHIIRESEIDFLFTVGRKDTFDTSSFVFTPNLTRPSLAVYFYTSDRLPRSAGERIYSSVKQAFSQIPPPVIFSRQAKERMRWQAQTGRVIRTRYLGGSTSGSEGKMSVKISANALLEFLQGRMSDSDFQEYIRPFRDRSLPLSIDGMKIKSINLEEKYDNHDDDYVVFEFEDDISQKKFADIADASVRKEGN